MAKTSPRQAPAARRLRHLARLWAPVSARPRLLLSVAVGLLAGLLLSLADTGGLLPRPVTRLIVAWNAGAWLYLALAGWMMVAATPSQIGGFLMALRLRGETVEEITAAARVMRGRPTA